MRLFIRHEVEQVFDPPVRFLNETLRLTPRSHESQHVVRWRVEIEGDSRIRAAEDAFGNTVHTLGVAGPTGVMRIIAEGVVETFDAAGIVRATVERFPPELFLRDTPLTTPDASLRTFAQRITGGAMIERLHALLLRLPHTRDEDAPDPEAGPEDACEDTPDDPSTAEALAHRFITCARLLGAPARFVNGYFLPPDAANGHRHCWAEAYVEGVGWIGFDPLNTICPHESHVRVAVGLDALDAAPARAAPHPAATTCKVVARRES